MSYRNSRRERSRESSPAYSNYREKPRDDYRESRHRNDHHVVDVPRSRHSIQINGLPATIKSYEVEDFLGKKVGGPLRTVYFKPDARNNEAVVAVRFDDLAKAKTCVETLNKTLMLGSKVFISYFEESSRPPDYIEKKQPRDDYRSPRDRSRDRSPIRSRSRPRYDHQDDFYTRTPPTGAFDYRNDERNKYYNNEKEIRSAQRNMPRRPPLLPPPSSSPLEANLMPSIDIHSKFSSHHPPAPAPYPINEKKQPRDDYRSLRDRSRDRSPIRSRSRPRYDRQDDFYTRTPPTGASDYLNDERSKYYDNEIEIRSAQRNMPRRPPLLPPPSSSPLEANLMPSIDIHSKFSSHHPPAPAPYPINGNLHSNNRPSNIIPPPGYSSVLPISRDNLHSSKFSASTFPDVKQSTEPKMNDQTWRTPDPDTFSAARLNTVQTLKYQPQEKKNDIQGLFRLGAVSMETSKNEMRKAKFISLSSQARTKVEEKKQELLKAYQDDCGTYGFLCQSLINKDSNLEESLRVALSEVLKDLEEGYKKTLDDFIDLFLTD
uniref:RRM domain-containing protein n=1 Tax=Panagrolaimus sp. ES5 TaxID=591445 RepID=A0AC34F817_9BILA